MYQRKTKVHDDDIHGLVATQGKIISGSKDTTVKRFHNNGRFEEVLSKPRESRDGRFSYTQWVTALDTFADGSFFAGHRNSFLLCKSLQNRFFFGGKTDAPIEARSTEKGAGAGYYKARNQARIMAIKCLNSPAGTDYSALIGVPEHFFKIDCATGVTSKCYKFDEPEWVYGFEQIPGGITATIHGCRLSLFRETEPGWDNVDMIFDGEAAAKSPDSVAGITRSLEEFRPFEVVSRKKKSSPSKKAPHQRPFISSVKAFAPEASPNLVALSLFGGMNKVIDLTSSTVIHAGSEHSQRVWQAIPVPGSAYEYATCADDKTVKVWDIRSGASSCMTFEGHPGRVSAMAFLNERRFVAGTCASDPSKDPDKAQFWFYEMRGGK